MVGSVFELRHLTAKTKTFLGLVTDALFTDDCAITAHDKNGLHIMLERFSTAIWIDNVS